MKYLLATAAICAATMSHGQVNPDCDAIAQLAEAYAESRMLGVPLPDMLDYAQSYPWETQDQEDLITLITEMIRGFRPTALERPALAVQ